LGRHLPVALVKIVLVYSPLAPIPHITISWQPKWPNFACWTLCMHPQHSHILRWHLLEHFPSILNAPTFFINVNQATPHKDIRLTMTSNELFITIVCQEVILNQHLD
jgi:hypothetical protein